MAPALVVPAAPHAALGAAASTRRQRFLNRVRQLMAFDTFSYYPAEDRFEEILSAQAKRWSPTGKSRLMPGLTIYGREVFNATEYEWRRFLEYHPLAVAKLSSEFNPPSEGGGVMDRDAFALIGKDRIK